MTPKESQKSNLAVELKTGRKRLKDALHGLSDEQCERAGTTRSGSVVDLLSEIVGFSAERLRTDAREAELNQAIADLSREDFLAGNFDLKSLFSLLFDRFYSEDVVVWLGTEDMRGRSAAFQRMAEVLEPFNTL